MGSGIIVSTLLIFCFLTFPPVNSTSVPPKTNGVSPAMNCGGTTNAPSTSNSSDSSEPEPSPIIYIKLINKNGTSAPLEADSAEPEGVTVAMNQTTTPSTTKSATITTPTTKGSIATSNPTATLNGTTNANATGSTGVEVPLEISPATYNVPATVNGTTNTTTGNSGIKLPLETATTNDSSIPAANGTREGKSVKLLGSDLSRPSANTTEQPRKATNGSPSNTTKVEALAIPEVEKPIAKKNASEVASSQVNPNIGGKNATVANGTTAATTTTTMPPTTDASTSANSAPSTIETKIVFIMTASVIFCMQTRS